MVWYGMIWYAMIWYGMLWYAMLSYAVVWYWKYGMLWDVNAMLWVCYAVVYVLKDKHSTSVNKIDSPLPKVALCQVWLNLAQWFWRRRWKCESLQTDWQTDGQRDGQTDHRQQAIRKAHLSCQLRWAKSVVFKNC